MAVQAEDSNASSIRRRRVWGSRWILRPPVLPVSLRRRRPARAFTRRSRI